MVQFWIGQGVDGFNIRDLSFWLEDKQLRNETQIYFSSNDYTSYTHNYTRDLNESYEIVNDIFVSTINEFPSSDRRKM